MKKPAQNAHSPEGLEARRVCWVILGCDCLDIVEIITKMRKLCCDIVAAIQPEMHFIALYLTRQPSFQEIQIWGDSSYLYTCLLESMQIEGWNCKPHNPKRMPITLSCQRNHNVANFVDNVDKISRLHTTQSSVEPCPFHKSITDWECQIGKEWAARDPCRSTQ
jgi:hypothetical protein